MDEDKRKKKNNKKKNKSNKSSKEFVVRREGASLDEIQGLQGRNTSSIINDNIISATELESEKNGHNAHGPAGTSSGEHTTELETRDSEKTEYNVEPFTAKTDEETQEYSETKYIDQRESQLWADCRALRCAGQGIFLWFPVKVIRVDIPSTGFIYFDVGVIYKQLSLSLFEDPPDCHDNISYVPRTALQ